MKPYLVRRWGLRTALHAVHDVGSVLPDVLARHGAAARDIALLPIAAQALPRPATQALPRALEGGPMV